VKIEIFEINVPVKNRIFVYRIFVYRIFVYRIFVPHKKLKKSTKTEVVLKKEFY